MGMTLMLDVGCPGIDQCGPFQVSTLGVVKPLQMSITDGLVDQKTLHSHLRPMYLVPVQSQLNPSKADTLQVPLFLHNEEQSSESGRRKESLCIEFILHFEIKTLVKEINRNSKLRRSGFLFLTFRT